jgi:arabinose-5-phosphate isomerase
MLALGDALALAVASRRKFDKEQFALYHPGGELGRKLMKVEEVMRGLSRCAVVGGGMTVSKALKRINQVPGRAGAACVTDKAGRMIGIFTDGDLRRCVTGGTAFLAKPISKVMTSPFKSVRRGSLAAEAARAMEEKGIDELPVLDAEGKLCGILDIQDLLKARLMPLDSEP